MKKQLLGLMTILTIFNACQKNEISVSLPEEVTIHATIEDKDATKTIMDENNNILWSESDQIIAFMKSSYGHKYQVKPSFVGKSYADFSMVSSGNSNDLSAGNEWEHNVVYYPYSENIECLKSGSNYVLEVNLPSEQVYVPDSFANGSMAMVAVSENNNITFKNILGGIKLQLKGTQTVKSIKIEGKNNEKLSGVAIVTAYTDDTKPAITMASGASTSVTLNCGSGAQLNESKATEFIISLPPVLFSKGFIVTITDSDSKTHVVETDKANTVLRSSLLIMPVIKVGSEQIPDEDIDVIPISKITLDRTSLSLPLNFSYSLIAKIAPIDATNQKVTWSSDNPSIVTVDQTGRFTTISAGEANILAEADGHYGSCKIVVIPQKTELVDYIDEYGVNHGPGVDLGGVIWAPVNCGYYAQSTEDSGFPYGKLYQWGRKYGQDYYTTSLELLEGPISPNGNNAQYSNTFFIADEPYCDWLSESDDSLWNSGTEDNPIKNILYDPCPEGWRIPTYREIKMLDDGNNSDFLINNGQWGKWFSGDYSYFETGPRIFLSAAGRRDNDGKAKKRGSYGDYWCSDTYKNTWSSSKYGTYTKYESYYFRLYDVGDCMNQYKEYSMPISSVGDRAMGQSVRCVQE